MIERISSPSLLLFLSGLKFAMKKIRSITHIPMLRQVPALPPQHLQKLQAVCFAGDLFRKVTTLQIVYFAGYDNAKDWIK